MTMELVCSWFYICRALETKAFFRCDDVPAKLDIYHVR